jgi:Cu-Zn family superoxide dismutase
MNMKPLNSKTLIPLLAATFAIAACSERAAEETPPTTTAPPVDAPTTAAAESTHAAVQLSPTEGNTASGMLAVTSDGTGVKISGSLQGLKPDSEFGFHIHEVGDCSAPDASSAGGHFNPTNAPHGNPQGDEHHAGDMLNASSNADGVAEVDAHAEGVTLRTGAANDVYGKAVVLHQKPDDYTTQPSGDSGDRIACGVITG